MNCFEKMLKGIVCSEKARFSLFRKCEGRTAKLHSAQRPSDLDHFLKMLSFSGKWVGFPTLSLQGSTSAGIANVPMKASSLSFEARDFLYTVRDKKKQNSVKSAEAI